MSVSSRTTRLRRLLRPSIITLGIGAIVSVNAVAEAVDFSRDVRPILANHCFRCHGPDENQRKAELRLDRPESLHAVTTPNSDGNVEMLRRITATDDSDRMPPPEAGRDLDPAQIETLRAWIEDGAPYEVHWAFQPPLRPPLPNTTNGNWPRTPVDHFVLKKLEEKGLNPSPTAEPATLLRRLSLDLCGLPPTLADLDRFLADPSPEAYAGEVDRLLDSPHYGERWGRHWLDLARYADSNGYSIDGPRAIWKYRDWVIDAFNADMPFDQFTIEQLAGDLLPNATLAQRVATGFHRNTLINKEGGVDPEEFRLEAVVDRVGTTASVWLGLTLNCAECHSHKFDPISQEEFYRFFAFFNNDNETKLDLPTPEQAAARKDIDTEARALSRDLRAYLRDTRDGPQQSWEAALTPDDTAEFADALREALKTPFAERKAAHQRLVDEAFAKQDPEHRTRKKAIDQLRKSAPSIATSLVLEARDQPRDTFIHKQGDFTRLGAKVQPGTPAILHPLQGAEGTRLDLAEWIVDSANPLTARVIVNQFWQRFFGVGLVETENDFGIQGRQPTHPELLDWLAVQFIESGWRVKDLHRLIVNSAVYRQSSRMRDDLAQADPLNRLLGRQNRYRLDAEIVRDVTLATAGVLNPTIGGPSVFPPQPDGVMSLGQQNRPWTISPGADRFRRGMYTYFWRATPHPALMVFDAPDAMVTCTRRVRSNTPLQALTLLNDAAFFELAKAFAARILNESLPLDIARIRYALRTAFSRRATDFEVNTLRALLNQQRKSFHNAPQRAASIADPQYFDGTPPVEAAAWTIVARTLLNTHEFITRE